MVYKVLHIPSAKYVILWFAQAQDNVGRMYPVFESDNIKKIHGILNGKKYSVGRDTCIQLYSKCNIESIVRGKVRDLNPNHFEIVEVDDV